jgi:hypothetical protein
MLPRVVGLVGKATGVTSVTVQLRERYAAASESMSWVGGVDTGLPGVRTAS